MTHSLDPLWTLEQLGARVAQALAVDYSGQANNRVRDLPNQRTIRYYTTLGLVDRAAWWRGRTALYSMRHLLQLVAIKRLQANGLSLVEIQARLVGLTDAVLRSVARLPADFDPQRSVAGDTAKSANAKEDRRTEKRFWQASSATLVGVPLEAGVTLLVESWRPLDEHDLSALRMAAAPLLKFLHVRRLVGGEGSDFHPRRNPMTQTLQPMTEEMMRAVTVPSTDGFGALETEKGVLPLQALDVQTRIDGLLAEMQLTQTFVNTHAEPLEATYIFPLPDRAAVTRFRLEVAGRIVEGELKERAAARQEYDQAIKEGHRAAITEEERPGVFTMRVGNLPPNETAKVMLTLTGPLPYSDGEATFRFPLVVAPRYIPGTPLPGPNVGAGVANDTNAVPDASRITPPVLLPGYPNPVRLSLAVEFAPSALAPSALRSSLHAVVEETTEKGRRLVVQPGERLNRDFILRFRIGEDKIVTALSLQPDADGKEGTFLLTLVPPASGPGAKTKPRDVVFVLDRSGSMAGWKIVAARRALARMVDTLTDQDRFTVYAFDDTIETPTDFAGNKLVAATNRHRFQAVEFLAKIDARGGTEMAQPLTQGVTELNALATERKTLAERDRILVLVTDGQVGNEDQILRDLGKQLKNVRVFTLGVDRAVNEAFLKRLADMGGGASRLVESEERLDEVMDDVHRHLGTAVLTNLRLEPAGLAFVPGSIVPSRMPDLFAGSPLTIMGRYTGSSVGALALQARDAAGQMWQAEVKANRATSAAPATVWARGRLRDLEDRYVVANDPALSKEIVATSLRFGVLCRFTAFVAVDRSSVVNPGGQLHGIVQPVEEPQGWEMGSTLLACAASLPVAAMSFRVSKMKKSAPRSAPGQAFLDAEMCDMDFSVRASSFDSVLEDGSDELESGSEVVPLTVNDWLQQFAAAGTDVNTRLTLLKTSIGFVEQLAQEAKTAGVEAHVVTRLEACVQALRQLLAEAQPSDDAVQDVWDEVVAALTEYHAATSAATPGRREKFWA